LGKIGSTNRSEPSMIGSHAGLFLPRVEGHHDGVELVLWGQPHYLTNVGEANEPYALESAVGTQHIAIDSHNHTHHNSAEDCNSGKRQGDVCCHSLIGLLLAPMHSAGRKSRIHN
jgi:hypothetical protein